MGNSKPPHPVLLPINKLIHKTGRGVFPITIGEPGGSRVCKMQELRVRRMELPKSGMWGHWVEGWLKQSRWEELDKKKLRTQRKTGTEGVSMWTQDQLHGPVTQTVTQSLLLRSNLCLV